MKRQWITAGIAALACTAPLSSKDKQAKVPYIDMAIGMRDAFNCGVIVEQYLHGSLKGNPDGYRKEQIKYNCDHVQTVLSTLHDQGADQDDQENRASPANPPAPANPPTPANPPN